MQHSINNISLKFGAGPAEKLDFVPGNLTVVVGPNNSGKSLFLRELESWLKGENDIFVSDKLSHSRIIADISQTFPSLEDLLTDYKKQGCDYYKGKWRSASYADSLLEHLESCHNNIASFQSKQEINKFITKQKVVRLDGKSRFFLSEEQLLGDVLNPPINHLTALCQDNQKRERLRKYLYDAFQEYFVIDLTNSGKARIRYSKTEPSDPKVELGYSEETKDFQSQATLITEYGDGVKAFTGIMSLVASQDTPYIFIDEPEVFLHPPLAKKLGRFLASISQDSESQLFIATHSSDFLLGCVEAGVHPNILRVSYTDSTPLAKLISAAEVKDLIRNPVIRASGVLDALFYKAVVVTEDDSDRIFYGEINNILRQNTKFGRDDVLFINVNGKSRMAEVITALRQIGIPAAGIIDIDVVYPGGGEMGRILSSNFIPKGVQDSLNAAKSNFIAAHPQASCKDELKQQGLEFNFATGQKQNLEFILENLAAHGYFIVPNGEMEGWLKDFGVNGSKGYWVEGVLTALPSFVESIPLTTNTTEAELKDVFQFINGLNKWLGDVNRKGLSICRDIPASQPVPS